MHQEPYSVRAANRLLASAAAQLWWVNTGLIGDRVPDSQKRFIFQRTGGRRYMAIEIVIAIFQILMMKYKFMQIGGERGKLGM